MKPIFWQQEVRSNLVMEKGVSRERRERWNGEGRSFLVRDRMIKDD